MRARLSLPLLFHVVGSAMRVDAFAVGFGSLQARKSLSPSTQIHRSLAMAQKDHTSRSKAAEQAEGTLIVGGGFAGLAAAAALRNIAGVSDVKVIEAVSEQSFKNVRAGAAAQLGPNGLKALRAIGGDAMVEEVINSGTKLVGNAIIMSGAGDERKEMLIPDTAEADTGLPQVLIRWGLLRQILASSLPADSICTDMGADITGYGQDGKGAWPTLKNGETLAPAKGQTSAPLLVAADGIYSVFRALVRSESQQLEGDVAALSRKDVKDGGRTNLKAVVPVALGDGFAAGTTYSFFSPNGGVACFAGPAGAGHTYWAISVADAGAEGGASTRFLDDVDASSGEAVKSALLSKLRGLELAECGFAVELIEQTEAAAILVQRSEELAQIAPRWLSEDGRVLLVGDGAHAMSPAYGQAANFAFEDAATLGACVREAETLGAALTAFSGRRVERCEEMTKRSAERARKAMKGEQAEDVSAWIFAWDLDTHP